ncbi:hypothetical protein O3G_MSEX010593 [Manduca sexta]|nr:hypothetical protein O3G_MSEX010593 [Manduca sexta]
MLRSDRMTFCEMYLQPEAAYDILSQLGEMSCVEFLDLNTDMQPFQRRYVAEVCRCAEMERKLRYMESEMTKDGIDVAEYAEEPRAMQPNEMMTYENLLEKWEEDVSEMSTNMTNLMKSFLEITEMYYMLSSVGPMLGDADMKKESMISSKRGAGDIGPGGRLAVLTGVVKRKRSFPLEMMLWRISRGNIYYRQAPKDKILQDPFTGKEIRKVAFLAICQGEQLENRMYKVFNGFRVNTYPCPKMSSERDDMMYILDTRLSDLEQVMKKTKHHRFKALLTVSKQWRHWMVQVKKAKAIYHTMNKFNIDITKKCLIGQCWVPDRDLRKVQDTLEQCSETLEINVSSFMSKTESFSVPPTYHRTNKFTHAFQNLIKAYGDSAYRELNPGLYTVVTFPFLFAVMFGDMGHALVMICFSGWMLKNEKKFMNKKSTNEIWNIMFGGRYIILLMGMFSFYTGFIYNDFFGKCVALTRSYWLNNYTKEALAKEVYLDVNPAGPTRKPYMFGIDPVISLSKNKIMILNSIKMKLAIIIGIIHMIFGTTLSLFNHIFFKRYYLITLRFIPEILMLMCLLLWLVFLIYFKWFKYGPKGSVKLDPTCAPQILILFIDMFLWAQSKPPQEECDAYMFGMQHEIQEILVIIAVLCVPMMLFGTPVYMYFHNRKMQREAYKKISSFRRYQSSPSNRNLEELIIAEANKYTTSFAELMIHQGVHTIEFVLSTISHTASYLRLWALSLAHAQLADMLWGMTLSKLALREHSINGAVKLVVIFGMWATFTVSILVVMEGLSAFLHTLRLHWVEFMSKFYAGEGHPFHPFCFKTILGGDAEKAEPSYKKK